MSINLKKERKKRERENRIVYFLKIKLARCTFRKKCTLPCRDGNIYPTCRDLNLLYAKDVRALSIGFETQESAPLCLNRDEDRLI